MKKQIHKKSRRASIARHGYANVDDKTMPSSVRLGLVESREPYLDLRVPEEFFYGKRLSFGFGRLAGM